MDLGSNNRPDLLDPATLASLGRVEIIAQWIVDGFLSGLHRSPRRGFSVEFAEHRAYFPGDDLRYLDWKIAGRTDRWVIKQFEEQTNLRATVVLDVSRSMNWSGAALDRNTQAATRLTKLAYAERLAASIALLLLRQRDAVGLIQFDEAVRSVVPPRSRHGQWRRLIGALEGVGAGRASSAASALEQAARLLDRRGMIVLLSDLLMDRDSIVTTVRGLRAAGHDVVVMHVMDPAERSLPPTGAGRFADPESGTEIRARASDVRAAYQETVTRVIDEWRTLLAAAGASYTLVMTDAPFGVPLRAAFAARPARA